MSSWKVLERPLPKWLPQFGSFETETGGLISSEITSETASLVFLVAEELGVEHEAD
jgi:hypothetical protein